MPYIVIPVPFQVSVKKWTLKDFGFSIPQSKSVIIFAIVIFGSFEIIQLLSGGGKIPVMLLVFALWQPAFIEEFFFRGILQGKLERALGQNKAWFLA